jgi:hypothetical protein
MAEGGITSEQNYTAFGVSIFRSCLDGHFERDLDVKELLVKKLQSSLTIRPLTILQAVSIRRE